MDKHLIEKGYKQYEPTQFDERGFVVARFQKRFDDENGKKYFIDVVKHSWDFVQPSRRDKWWKEFTYEYEVQVTFGENKNSLNLNFFSSWTIEEVEEYMEKFFDVMGVNYYEKWSECQCMKVNAKW